VLRTRLARQSYDERSDPCKAINIRESGEGKSMRQTSASANAVHPSFFAHELTYLEWARRFHRHLAFVSPDLALLDRLWTSVHWLSEWDLYGPERAAEVSAGWWSAPVITANRSPQFV